MHLKHLLIFSVAISVGILHLEIHSNRSFANQFETDNNPLTPTTPESSDSTPATTTPTAAQPAANDDVLLKLPFITKKPDFGGEACVAMCLRGLGLNADQDVVFDASSLDPVLGRGCHTKELTAATKQLGFKNGKVWHSIESDSDLDSVWQTVLTDLKSGRPTVVCRIAKQAEQFVLVTGYKKSSDEIIFNDPNSSGGEGQKLGRLEFMKSCRLGLQQAADGRTKGSVVSIRLTGDRLKVPETSKGYTDADFAQHIRKLKQRLPHENFHIVLQKPFVVVGDGTPNQVSRTSKGTVKWAVDAIKKDYFKKDPYFIIDVWLFKNPESYQKHNKELFNSKPGTPYGYYSPTHKVLVMDISTGGGTLVHEIVHPFMESNFEACPAWFNEGLASLYEQSASRNGHIVGLTNWRLRGLQLAIEDGRLPSFKELCTTTTREFYDGHGTNYAQARYLCYYLQERNLLHKYYEEFVKNAAKDPGGYTTLKQVLGRDDIEAFQKKWEAYVLKLRFGR